MFRKKREGSLGSALVLFPDQLYKFADLPQVDRIYLIEDPLFFGNDQTYPFSIHGAKLLFMRASMQAYVDTVIWPAKVQVDYMENHDDLWSGAGIAKAALDGFQTIYVFDPTDHRLKSRLHKAAQDLVDGFEVVWLSPPNFYLKPGETEDFFEGKKTDFVSFYQWQRERFNILLGKNYKPVGGDWMLEPASKVVKPAPTGIQSFGENKYVKEAYKYVEHRFDHYHDLPDHFIWPIDHNEASEWLKSFTQTRLKGYAASSQAIDLDSVWSGRSVLSPLLNSGLLYGQDAIDTVLKMHAKKPAAIEDVELFVRNILGWREYVRGYYLRHGQQMTESNYFDAVRGLTDSWRVGTTGLKPIDALINQARQNAYLSSQERVVLAALMLLIGISPQQVALWFHEMTIDSQEWQVTTHVYAATQYAYGKSSMLASPPVFQSTRLVDMGVDHDQSWQEVWDGLYHRFIDMHRDKLAKDMVKAHDGLAEDIKRVLGYRAGDFLAEHTLRPR